MAESIINAAAALEPPITDEQRPICSQFYGRIFHPADWKRVVFDQQDEDVDYVRIKLPKALLEQFQNTGREYENLLLARESLVAFKIAVAPVVPALMEKTHYDPSGPIDWAKVGAVLVEALQPQQDRLNARKHLLLPPGLVAPA